MYKLIAATLVAALVVLVGCQTSDPHKVRMGQALVYHKDGRHESAITEYTEVLSIDNIEHAEVWYNLGQLWDQRGNHVRAEGKYRKALELYRTDQTVHRAQAHMSLGAIYFAREQFINARDQYEQAAELDPSDPRVHQNIGVTSEALIASDGLHNQDRAIDAYHRALDLNPQYADAHLSLAFIYETKGFIEQARYHHSHARQNGIDDPGLVVRLEWWANWRDQEITARKGTGAEREEGKVVVDYPRNWTLGTAARAGTTIVRTYLNTAAIVIGERAAVQVVGPESVTMRHIDADMLPARFAQSRLAEWLQRNMPDAFEAYLAWAQGDDDDDLEGTDEIGGENGDTSEEEPGTATDSLRERGNFRDFAQEQISYADGTSGYRIRTIYTSTDGSERELNFYYYLGDAHSYVLVTTQEPIGGNINRTRFALERIVRTFQEETRTRR